jgi:hypothetical protein
MRSSRASIVELAVFANVDCKNAATHRGFGVLALMSVFALETGVKLNPVHEERDETAEGAAGENCTIGPQHCLTR